MEKLLAIKCPNHRKKGNDTGCLCNGIILQDYSTNYAYCNKCRVFFYQYREDNGILHLDEINKGLLEFSWEPFLLD